MRKGQFVGGTALMTTMIMMFVMAGIGAFVLSSIGTQDTTTATGNNINQSLGLAFTNQTPITINQSRIQTSTFVLYNVTGTTVTVVPAVNYRLTEYTDFRGYVRTNLTVTGGLFNNTLYWTNYSFLYFSGATYNLTGNANVGIQNFSIQMAVYGVVGASLLILGLVMLIAGLVGRRY